MGRTVKTITELVGLFIVSQRSGALDPKALPPDVSAGWWLHNHGTNALQAFDRQFPVWTPTTGSDVRKLIADALLLNTFRVIA